MEIFENLTERQIQCLIALLIGIFLRYLIGRRRFKRRNGLGLQQFDNYLTGVIVTFLEKLFMLLANLLIIGGIVLLIISHKS